MVEAMSHGGGSSSQVSCTSASLGKYVRRALSGRPKRIKDKRKKRKPRDKSVDGGGGVSLELISSSSSSSASVVRVVLWSGVVEVYTGVVLACTVIRNHPPGLCLAHPDVFRNPHGARVRPLEPLFPGQKFVLIPESTMIRLLRDIPEGSVGAFDEEEEDNHEEEEDADGSEEVTTSTETTSSSEGQDHSGVEASSEERQTEPAEAGDDGGGSMLMSGCCAREYFVAKERWAECKFKQMVGRGLAVEQSAEPAERKEKGTKKEKGKKKTNKKGKKRNDPAAAPSAGCRTFSRVAAAPRRTWEPRLPSVQEEIIVSPLHPPSSETRADDETS